MKKALLFTFATFFSGILSAQIPNSDFEYWSSGSPIGWSISNGVPNGVTQSFNAYNGNYAVKLAVGNFMGTNFGGYIISGTGSQPFFGITTTPVALTGWYILNSLDSDNLLITTTLKCSGSSNVGAGANQPFNSTSVYKQFFVNYYYTGGCTADSAIISISLVSKTKATFGLNISSYAIIDYLSFTQSSGIQPVNSDAAVLEPCEPNPANFTTDIIYSIPSYSTVTVALYNIMGQKINTLLDNTKQEEGRYKIPLDVSTLTNGMYFYSLTVNGQTLTQKLIVAR